MLPRYVAQRSTVYLAQPEQESRDVGVAPEISKVLRRNESAIVFSVYKRPVVNRVRRNTIIGNPAEDHARAALVEQINQSCSLRAKVGAAVTQDIRQ